jgi:hypothetical protein
MGSVHEMTFTDGKEKCEASGDIGLAVKMEG